MSRKKARYCSTGPDRLSASNDTTEEVYRANHAPSRWPSIVPCQHYGAVIKFVRDQCLRQLSLPWNPLVVLRLENGGMSREGGPESAFRLACALEGAGVVVMDAGAGRMHTKVC